MMWMTISLRWNELYIYVSRWILLNQTTSIETWATVYFRMDGKMTVYVYVCLWMVSPPLSSQLVDSKYQWITNLSHSVSLLLSSKSLDSQYFALKEEEFVQSISSDSIPRDLWLYECIQWNGCNIWLISLFLQKIYLIQWLACFHFISSYNM